MTLNKIYAKAYFVYLGEQNYTVFPSSLPCTSEGKKETSIYY